MKRFESELADLEGRLVEMADLTRSMVALATGGVFAHPRHHGFVCHRHTPADVDKVLDLVRNAARAL